MTVFPSLAFFIGLAVQCVPSRAQNVKNWLTNTNYDNPKNWDRGSVPCLTDNAIFPSDLNLPVALPESLIEVRSVVLPRAGVIVLPDSTLNAFAGLTLSSKSIHASCIGGDVTFTRKGVAYWADPKQWSGWNEATPHLERIPCSTDIARFPDHSTFYVATPRKQPTVAFVEIKGQRLSGTLLTNMLTSAMGTEEFPMGEFITATGRTCQNPGGCECDNDFLTEDVCSRVTASPSQCDNQVKPIGFCHPICGAYFLFHNGSVDKVKKFVDDFPEAKDAISHVSKTSGFLQIVLTEKEGTSVGGSMEQIASELYNALVDSSLVGVLENIDSLHVSGMRYGEVNLIRSLNDFMTMALGAVICFILLVCIYQTDRPIFKHFNFGTRVQDGVIAFARFENHGDVVDLIQEDVVPTIREESNRGREDLSTGLAFQNILYSEADVSLKDLSYADHSAQAATTDESCRAVEKDQRALEECEQMLLNEEDDTIEDI